MSYPYFWVRLMPSYSACLQIEFRLSPGDGLGGLPSCPSWF